MIFIDNKYSRVYYRIVERAKTRLLPENIYTEKHHIMPKSLGGSNSKENIVQLTAKEHYVCHRLLIRMTLGKDKSKMHYALYAMITLRKDNREIKVSAKTFERIRENRSLEITKRKKGRKFDDLSSAEQQNLMKMWDKRRGSKMTPESIAQREKTKTERGSRRLPPNHTGVKRSEEIKEKLKNLRWINDGISNTKIPADLMLPDGYTYGRCNFRKTNKG